MHLTRENIIPFSINKNGRYTFRCTYIKIVNAGNITADIMAGYTLEPGREIEFFVSSEKNILIVDLQVNFDKDQEALLPSGNKRIDVLYQITKYTQDYPY